MLSHALISKDNLYRYWLTRLWDSALPVLVFIMLNPSVADAKKDDATIRRCIRFACDNGYGGICVVNLYAFRATDPRHLEYAAFPVGKWNDKFIMQAVFRHNNVVCAWGAQPITRDHRAAEVYHMIKDFCEPLCLGTTVLGYPRHPLYVAANQSLIPYGLPS